MDKLLEALAEKGIKMSGCEDDEIKKVAKNVGIDPIDYLDREVEIVQHENKRDEKNTFVKTPSFVVGRKDNGMAQTVRGFFLRVEALPQAIADLTAAQAMLDEAEAPE